MTLWHNKQYCSGSLEFLVPGAVDVSEFFPILVKFKAKSTYSNLKVYMCNLVKYEDFISSILQINSASMCSVIDWSMYIYCSSLSSLWRNKMLHQSLCTIHSWRLRIMRLKARYEILWGVLCTIHSWSFRVLFALLLWWHFWTLIKLFGNLMLIGGKSKYVSISRLVICQAKLCAPEFMLHQSLCTIHSWRLRIMRLKARYEILWGVLCTIHSWSFRVLFALLLWWHFWTLIKLFGNLMLIGGKSKYVSISRLVICQAKLCAFVCASDFDGLMLWWLTYMPCLWAWFWTIESEILVAWLSQNPFSVLFENVYYLTIDDTVSILIRNWYFEVPRLNMSD